MKYSLTKEEVFEAILTEPLLKNGFFFSSDKLRGYGDRDDGKCAVCAVGTILRTVQTKKFNSDNAEEVTNFVYSGCETDILSAYKDNNFLSILSTEFEHASDHWYWEGNTKLEGGFIERIQDYDFDLARFHALMIVEAMCPDVLEFEI